MNRSTMLLAGLGALVATGLVVWLLARTSGGRSDGVASGGGEATPSRPSLPSPAGASSSRAARATPTIAGKPTPTRDGGLLAEPEEVARELGQAREQLTRAARDCYGVASRLDRTQTLRLRFTIVVDNGGAHAGRPAVLDGSLVDERARTCLIDAFAAATWRSSSQDRHLTFEWELSLAELFD